MVLHGNTDGLVVGEEVVLTGTGGPSEALLTVAYGYTVMNHTLTMVIAVLEQTEQNNVSCCCACD